MDKIKALFLDLDGTVIKSRSGQDFIEDESDVALYSGIEKRIWAYKDEGYYIFGVSNQGGVAFGIKSEDEHELILYEMETLFDRNPFDHTELAFYHEKGRMNKSAVIDYRWHPNQRKPNEGMLHSCVNYIADCESARQGHHLYTFRVQDWLDFDNSIMVGDRDEDELCATRFGVRFQTAYDFRNSPVMIFNKDRAVSKPQIKTDMHIEATFNRNYHITAASEAAIRFMNDNFGKQQFGACKVTRPSKLYSKFDLTIEPIYDEKEVIDYIKGYLHEE